MLIGSKRITRVEIDEYYTLEDSIEEDYKEAREEDMEEEEVKDTVGEEVDNPPI
jgi:hypothetical protein